MCKAHWKPNIVKFLKHFLEKQVPKVHTVLLNAFFFFEKLFALAFWH